MSAEDAWQLKIPIRLALSGSEITSPVDVKPVYLLAPRHSYLPVLAQQCLSFFQHVLLSPPGQSIPTPWFEYQGAPLNWTQPIGVLYDLLSPSLTAVLAEAATASPAPFSAGSQGHSAPASPWCLIVHYQNMPSSLINSWQNLGTAKDHYFSSLKEAGYCYRGSDGSGAVMRLPGPAQDDLWSAVNRGDGARVQAVMSQLRMQPTQKSGGSTYSVPVRIYIRRHRHGGADEGLTGLWANTHSSSRPINLIQPGGHETLLAHVLNMVMPQQFPELQPAAAAAAAADSQQQLGQPQCPEHHLQARVKDLSSNAAAACAHVATGESRMNSSSVDPAESLEVLKPVSDGATEATAGATAGSQPAVSAVVADLVATEGSHDLLQQHDAAQAPVLKTQTAVPMAGDHVLPHGWPTTGVRVLVCGVQPDWCTPLGWLHRHLRAADGFLYIVVHLLDAC